MKKNGGCPLIRACSLIRSNTVILPASCRLFFATCRLIVDDLMSRDDYTCSNVFTVFYKFSHHHLSETASMVCGLFLLVQSVLMQRNYLNMRSL